MGRKHINFNGNQNGKTNIQWSFNISFQQCLDYHIASLQLMALCVFSTLLPKRPFASENPRENRERWGDVKANRLTLPIVSHSSSFLSYFIFIFTFTYLLFGPFDPTSSWHYVELWQSLSLRLLRQIQYRLRQVRTSTQPTSTNLDMFHADRHTTSWLALSEPMVVKHRQKIFVL